MENLTPISSLLGGLLIGSSAAMMLVGLGRIAGVSGIFGGLLVRTRADVAWRLAFVLGLVAGGAVMSASSPALFENSLERSLLTVALAGALVGVGTRLANGCTSGHGVCGISRGSRRSIVATMIFMMTGALTVFVTQHVLGLGGGR